MRNSRKVAVAGTETKPTPALTETQLADFWNGIIANEGAAKRTAAGIVPLHDVDDVVSSASVLFIESLQRAESPASFPRDDDAFRRRYLAIVRNHALDCVRDPQAAEARPVRSHWGDELEPIVGGRKIADRPLDQVFARNDEDFYDAPAPPKARPEDNVDRLEQILLQEVDQLPRMQRLVILETFVERRKRAEVAARHGISVRTYDSHLQKAFYTLRDDLWYQAFVHDVDDRSSWYDRIEELSDRHDGVEGKRIMEQLLAEAKATRQEEQPQDEGDADSSEGVA